MATVSRFRSGREFQRYSFAPTPKISVSLASKSIFNPYSEVILSEITDIRNMYSLSDILECSMEDILTTTIAEDKLAHYVKKLIPSGASVQPRCAMKVNPETRTLGISPSVFPDGSASTKLTELIWEVESVNWKEKRVKLHMELAMQLTCFRNKFQPNDSIKQVIGFYFPFRSQECVVEITLKWSDERLQFIEERKYLQLHEVPDAIKGAYEHNHQLVQGTMLKEDEVIEHTYPLSTQFLSSRNLKQIRTGQSIVLLDPNARKVYKYPIPTTETKNLQSMQYLHHLHQLLSLTSESRVVFPRAATESLNTSVEYFVFDMYDPPLSKDDAKTHIEWFVDEVVLAVNELHKLNIAHLDIRLENFCVDQTNDQLKLIDLDRSESGSKVKNLFDRYGSEMYKPESLEWNLLNLDWKQVGLMIEDIQGTSHDFITKLKAEGTYDSTLHQRWKNDL